MSPQSSESRHPPRSRWRPAAALALALTPLSRAHASEFEDTTRLQELARQEAGRELPPLTDKQRLEVGPVQRQLARCESAVTAAKAAGVAVAGRVLIELSCAGRKPWHVFVPVKVIGTTSVVVAAHALVPGTVLTPNDVTVQNRDLTGLPPGFFDDPAITLGLSTGRAIAGGSILTNQQLLGTNAVRRGQSVTLFADAGGISVRMEGRALTDGLVNQRVKVVNLSSGKVVEGVAKSAQVVEIIF